ncbi:MAG TPA: hypothetical protein VMA71_01980 [Alloacidobacterium sp.]|nr:hypothetical protein [Alloacidobacterium sp.]
MTRSRRCRKATQAALLGWLAGFIITSPAQIVEVLRNSGPDFQLMTSALGYGFALWLLITFAVAALVWVCAVLPVSLFVHEQWLLQHRRAVIVVSVCLGVATVSYKIDVLGHFEHNGVGLMNFWIYACFAAVFAGIAAHFYLQFLAREQAA